MLTDNFRHSAANLLVTLLIPVSGIFLSATTSYCDSFSAWGNTRQCELSLQLQNQPSYRAEYIAKLATEVGNYWASNNNAATVSDASDDSGFTLISFINNEKSSRNSETGDIDSFSKDCLSCHDGVRASDVKVTYRDSPGFRGKRYAGGKDHPIGMNYASYVGFGRGYKPVSNFNAKMVFIDGKVGCMTCHNPLNPEKNHLVMSDFRSALCLTCHDK